MEVKRFTKGIDINSDNNNNNNKITKEGVFSFLFFFVDKSNNFMN